MRRVLRQLYHRLASHGCTGLPFAVLAVIYACAFALLFSIIQSPIVRAPFVAVDIRVANIFYTLRNDWLLSVFAVITLAAEPIVIIIATGILIILFVVRRQRAQLLGLCVALTASEVVTFVGKIFFRRERPNALFRAITENSYSFPSGHATAVVAFYGFLAYLIIRNRRAPHAYVTTAFAMVVLVLLIILIDASRLYLGVHYLSDVLAGNLIGLAGLLLAIGAMKWFVAKNRTANGDTSTRSSPEPLQTH